MSDVVITIAARNQGVHQALEQVLQGIENVGGKVDINNRRMQKGKQEADGMFGAIAKGASNAINSLTGVTGAVGALLAGWRLLNAEIDRFRDTRMGLVEPFMDAEVSRERLRQIVGPEMTKEQQESFLDQVAEWSKAGGLRKPGQGTNLAGRMFGAAGGVLGIEKTSELFRELVTTYGPITPGEELEDLGLAAATAMMAMSPEDRERISARDFIGKIIASQQFSLATREAEQGYMFRGVSYGMARRDKFEDAMADAIVTQHLSLDPHGRRGSTAHITALARVSEKATEVAAKGYGTEDDLANFLAMSGTQQREFVRGGFAPGATEWQQALAARLVGMGGATELGYPHIAELAQAAGWTDRFGGIGGEMASARATEAWVSPPGSTLGDQFDSIRREALDAIQKAGAHTVDKLMQDRSAEIKAYARTQGNIGFAETNRTTGMYQGLYMKATEEFDRAMGRGAVHQWINRFYTERQARKIGTPEEGQLLMRQLYREQQQEMLSAEYGLFEKIGDQRDPAERAKLFGRMTPEERKLYRSLEKARIEEGGKVSPHYSPSEFEKHLGPEARDGAMLQMRNLQNAIEENTRVTRELARAGTVKFQLEDPAGRPLTRARSLPRAVEALG